MSDNENVTDRAPYPYVTDQETGRWTRPITMMTEADLQRMIARTVAMIVCAAILGYIIVKWLASLFQ